MAENEPPEGRSGVTRVEAFSDGVLAIILTIMVLELEAPEESGFDALWQLWPTFFAYVLSYVYIAIYWVNHHKLFSHARMVTSQLLWANIALLFSLSFLPFSTAYVGKHLAEPEPTALYMVTLLSPALCYYWLQKVISRSGAQDDAAQRYYKAMKRKCLAAAAIYALAVPLSFVSSGISLSIAGLVAAFWVIPWGPLDRLFLGREDR